MTARRAEQPEPKTDSEFPDWVAIEAGADFEAFDPTDFKGKDPNKAYWLAAKSGPSDRSDGVEALKRRGWRVSSLKHNSADCVLMEMARDQYEAMKRYEVGLTNNKVKAVTAPPKELRQLRPKHGVIKTE
ncbi:MAG: hypothetical protein GY835_24010 [bacterium]|nr:hypothetical protein [bacterium]